MSIKSVYICIFLAIKHWHIRYFRWRWWGWGWRRSMQKRRIWIGYESYSLFDVRRCKISIYRYRKLSNTSMPSNNRIRSWRECSQYVIIRSNMI
jgi:hypothetical protein